MDEPARVGILGGTFDPIHFGHLRAAESLRELMGLNRIRFVPARVPPHKQSGGVATAEDRYEMVRCAVRNEPHFEVSRVEIERSGPSYTVETLAEIRRRHPDEALFFLTGSDAFRDIRTWKQWEELLDNYSFIVHARPGWGLVAAMDAVPERMRSRIVTVGAEEPPPKRVGPTLYFAEPLTLNISATEIRRLARCGRSIHYLVPLEVEDYIRENRLYEDVR